MGHVRDLPKRKLGLDVAQGYKPSYEVVPAKKDTIGDLKRGRGQGRAGLSGDRPRPRGRGHRLASAAGPRAARRPGPPRHLPRDHRACRQGRIRPRPARSTWTWSTPSRPDGSWTDSSAISSALSSGRRWRAEPERRPRPVGRRPADRRPRARHPGVRHRGILEDHRDREPGRLDRRDRPVQGRAWPSTTAPSSRPRPRPRPTPIRDALAVGPLRRLQGRRDREARQGRRPVQDQHAPAAGRHPAAVLGQADHEGRPGALRGHRRRRHRARSA